jgi:hypothetical protein
MQRAKLFGSVFLQICIFNEAFDYAKVQQGIMRVAAVVSCSCRTIKGLADMDQEAATLALQLANQLPEDFALSGTVLGYLDQLRHWRAGKTLPQQFSKFDVKDDHPHEVVLLRREGVGGSSSASPLSLRSSDTDSPSVFPK